MPVPTKKPNPIDIHVGSRVKLSRVMKGWTQEKLGDSIGVTFQQIQKYEKGVNRISASRLQKISDLLDTPVAFFFEDAPHKGDAKNVGLEESSSNEYVIDFLSSSEGLKLNRAFLQIKDPKIREKIIDLVQSIAYGNEKE